MPKRDKSAIRPSTSTTLIGVSLTRRRVLSWMLVPAAQFVTSGAWAVARRIASARLWPAQEYTRLIIESSAPLEHQLVVLREPNRVVLDIARVDPTPELRDLPAHVQVTDPYIAAIRIGAQSGGFLRVVIELKQDVNPQVFALPPVAEFGYRLVVDLYPLTPLDPLMALLESEQRKEAPRQLAPGANPPPSTRLEPPPKSNVRRITIAIDAGHGGEDPGAVGKRGTY